jgi:hypothetical protein
MIECEPHSLFLTTWWSQCFAICYGSTHCVSRDSKTNLWVVTSIKKEEEEEIEPKPKKKEKRKK